MYYNENGPNEVYKAKATAQQLRYKKSIAKGFNLYDIQNELSELCEECGNVRWCIDGNEDELIEALEVTRRKHLNFGYCFPNYRQKRKNCIQGLMKPI